MFRPFMRFNRVLCVATGIRSHDFCHDHLTDIQIANLNRITPLHADPMILTFPYKGITAVNLKPHQNGKGTVLSSSLANDLLLDGEPLEVQCNGNVTCAATSHLIGSVDFDARRFELSPSFHKTIFGLAEWAFEPKLSGTPYTGESITVKRKSVQCGTVTRAPLLLAGKQVEINAQKIFYCRPYAFDSNQWLESEDGTRVATVQWGRYNRESYEFHPHKIVWNK